MAAHKGHVKVGGRAKGTPNKTTLSLKAAFQEHGNTLVKALLALAKSKDENIRLRAIQTCLERGWGRPAQPLTGEDGQQLAIVAIRRVIVDERKGMAALEERVGLVPLDNRVELVPARLPPLEHGKPIPAPDQTVAGGSWTPLGSELNPLITKGND